MKPLFRFIKRIHYRTCKAAREFWLTNILKECGHTLRAYGSIYIDHPENITFANYVAVNAGVKLMGRGGITLGEHVVLSPGAVVTSDSLVYSNYTMPRPHNSAPVVLEDGVWVCANAVILPGVTVGKNSVVAAGSVVTKNVPANVLVAGVPAVIRKQIS